MIKINSWNSQTVSRLDSTKLGATYDVTYTYDGQYDDRGDWVSSHVINVSNKVVKVTFCPLDVALSIDGEPFGIRKFGAYVIPKGKILIDATTLGLPELLHLFKLLNDNGRAFDVIYVQPTGYSQLKSSGLDKIKAYDLSDDGLGIQQVPPYIGYSSNSTIFFFLGFEGHRFGALINSDEFDTSHLTCLIGSPPFKLGWENTSLSNNYKQLADLSCNSNSRFKFAGANDPLRTYEVIEQVYKSAEYDRRNLCLAPFGTKPATIAAAQFAVNNANVVVLYDFVKKKLKRSLGTDLVHLWEFSHFN